jgi:hypothetical protein
LARFGRNRVRGEETSRGLRCFLSSSRHQTGLAAILQPVTLAAHVDGRRVVQQPVQIALAMIESPKIDVVEPNQSW